MKQIKLCTHCKGEGTVETRHGRNGYETHECVNCSGTGRVVELSYSFDVPFGTELHSSIDEEIMALIKSATA